MLKQPVTMTLGRSGSSDVYWRKDEVKRVNVIKYRGLGQTSNNAKHHIATITTNPWQVHQTSGLTSSSDEKGRLCSQPLSTLQPAPLTRRHNYSRVMTPKLCSSFWPGVTHCLATGESSWPILRLTLFAVKPLDMTLLGTLFPIEVEEWTQGGVDRITWKPDQRCRGEHGERKDENKHGYRCRSNRLRRMLICVSECDEHWCRQHTVLVDSGWMVELTSTMIGWRERGIFAVCLALTGWR